MKELFKLKAVVTAVVIGIVIAMLFTFIDKNVDKRYSNLSFEQQKAANMYNYQKTINMQMQINM